MNRYWYDDEIDKFEDDRLGRSAYARRLAQLIIDSHSWQSSVVFGLTGPWGSGKSSMIRLVSRALTESSDGKLGGWIVARFTPWATNNDTELLAEFYAAISAALPAKVGDKAKDALSQCIKILVPALQVIPGAGGVAESAKAVDQLLQPPPSWEQVFRKCEAELRKLQIPVLIVADDIDRLQRHELLSLLKVVRLLGRFGGVNYLLAYDERTLHSHLHHPSEQHADSRSGRLFMEKIVQYPMAIPPLLPSQMRKRLNEGLLDSGQRTGWHVDATDSRLGDLDGVFQRQFTTLRSVDRFLAQVEVLAPLHEPDEIDVVDLILMTFLRMQFPDLYAQLPRWRGELTKSFSAASLMRGYDEPNWDELLSHVQDDEDRLDARRVLGALFPALDGFTSSGESLRGAHHALYFNRYLVHAIPDGDIADTAILAALREASMFGPEGVGLAALLTDADPDRVGLALDKLERLSEIGAEEGNARTSVALLKAVVALLPRLQSAAESIFAPQRHAIVWAGKLYGALSERADPAALLDALLTADSIEHALHVRTVSHRPEFVKGRGETDLKVAADLADRAMAGALEHLRDRDAADPMTPFPFLVDGVRQGGQLDKLQAAIAAEIADGHFTVDDLAARYVGIAHPVGNVDAKSITGFDRERFLLVAPPTLHFASEPPTPGSEDDTSWPNRRAVAYAQRDEMLDLGVRLAQ